MTDDRERVITGLRQGLDAGTAVRIAWAEAPAESPAVVLMPARCMPVNRSGAQLTDITQTLRLTARSYAHLLRLAAQTESVMRGLGYSMTEMSPEDGLPRAVTMRFQGVTDGENAYWRAD